MADFNAFVNMTERALSDIGVKVIAFDEIGSTNLEAKWYAADAADPSPVLFLARSQSAGRGRLGRDFISRPDLGIYMTLLYFTPDDIGSAVTVTTAAAVAAATSIENVMGERIAIKWVNDLYFKGKKAAGILVESLAVSGGYAVAVGIGINVGASELPRAICNVAISLGELCESERANIVAQTCKKILEHAKDHKNRAYMAEYRKRFMLQDRKVTLWVAGEAVMSGRACGVDDSGALLILPDGETETRSISSGEVTVRPE
ncbi:MAG: biotin--[Clostridia bacterium]|nr:biotin--[acetyl-CoA-carboxylase] ligase [Clostridia bacterium]